MRRGTTNNSWDDLQTSTNSFLSESSGFDDQLYHSNKQNHQQTKATTYYEKEHSTAPRRPISPPAIRTNNNNERAKSADHSRATLNETTTMASLSSPTYTDTFNNTITSRLSRATNARSNGTIASTSSSKIYIDELRTAQQEEEKQELNTLNNRFGNYLDKIKHLAHINANLRRQVDDAYRKYMGHTEDQQITMNNQTKIIQRYQHPYESQLNNLRKQINDEVRVQTIIHIRLQRADYDIKFYQTNIKLLSKHDQNQSDQIRIVRQQLEANLQELEQLKHQYERREQDLKIYKSQHNEYMDKLIEFTNEYDSITYERMENENHLHTLKEQLAFEQEYYQQRQQEFAYIEKFQYDFTKEFNKNEFHNIIKRIREDYQEFNTARLAELEILYKSKLDTFRNEITKRDEQQATPPKPREIRVILDTTKKEHRILIEQNQLLTSKLEQLEHDLNDIIEQNRQHYEVSDREYRQLQIDIPDLDCIIVHLRENTVNLWSEINTYRYLLVNLLSSNNEKSQPTLSHPIPPPPIDRPKPIENYTTISTDNHILPPTNSKSMVKPIIKKVTTTTTMGTKSKPYIEQYRDEATGFIVHIENGIIWVRI